MYSLHSIDLKESIRKAAMIVMLCSLGSDIPLEVAVNLHVLSDDRVAGNLAYGVNSLLVGFNCTRYGILFCHLAIISSCFKILYSSIFVFDRMAVPPPYHAGLRISNPACFFQDNTIGLRDNNL
jgi:hypothetical protein